MATINGKTVLLNESILFAEGQTVEFVGAFPLRISANSAATGGINMTMVGNVFHLSLDGLSAANMAQVGTGTGTLHGVPIQYLIHALHAGTLGTVNIYDVKFTAFPV